MGYPRNEENTDKAVDFDSPNTSGRYGQGARPDDQSSARRYAAAGYFDQERGQQDGRQQDRSQHEGGYRRDRGAGDYGDRSYGESSRAIGRDWTDTARSDGQGYGYGERTDRDRGYGQGGYGQNQYGEDRYGQRGYAGQYRDQDRNRPQGGSATYDRDERGFINRAGDEVRSWFGDDDAAHRRELDQRFDNSSDSDYYSWRRSQIDALDRDYDEYRRENQAKFQGEFHNFRTERQGQRSSLSQVSDHMEVVGSDGLHVGTVDKVRGDRIILTKNDKNADGKHHSIPSRWIETVADKVTIRKTAQEAMDHWREEERSSDDEPQPGAPGRRYSGY